MPSHIGPRRGCTGLARTGHCAMIDARLHMTELRRGGRTIAPNACKELPGTLPTIPFHGR